MIKKIANKLIKEFNLFLPVLASPAEIEKVYNFFTTYSDFRLLSTCAQETGLSIWKCARIKKHLYRTRRLGLYFFAASLPPQKFMAEHIQREFPEINANSKILEIGPGQVPIFNYQNYPNWLGVDKFFRDGQIDFKAQAWAKNKYPSGKIINASFENLSTAIDSNWLGSFDLVVSSHAYEHTLKPIQALREMAKMLKVGGLLVLFVPDGFSDDPLAKDPTHTLYINPAMMQEFFAASAGFTDIEIKSFRPNADLIISARKI
jgi:SAM-dependent methyltransferase